MESKSSDRGKNGWGRWRQGKRKKSHTRSGGENIAVPAEKKLLVRRGAEILFYGAWSDVNGGRGGRETLEGGKRKDCSRVGSKIDNTRLQPPTDGFLSTLRREKKIEGNKSPQLKRPTLGRRSSPFGDDSSRERGGRQKKIRRS